MNGAGGPAATQVDGTGGKVDEVDVVVVGAGFSGLYLLHRLRQQGRTAVVVEAADDVGGTWYWNRYPGARCDIPTTDYTFGFDPDLEDAWTWSEKYATQPEILDYLRFVADRYDLRRDIRLATRVRSARWDADAARWRVAAGPDELRCRFLVMATGCLSQPKAVDVPGLDDFEGDLFATSTWPHDGVDLTGKRVAVIGTGSSGVQSIPLIAEQAAELTVFQRTPNFAIPAGNGPIPAARRDALAADRPGYRDAAKHSRGGIPGHDNEEMILGVTASDEVRRERFEAAWEGGELFGILGVFDDQLVNPVSNEIVAEMIREKIRAKVDDPATAALLCPTDHPFGTKRPCLDSGYYETYNRPNVTLVDLRREPIDRVVTTGIATVERTYEVDAIVLATGFDAMTGAIVAVDITGRDGTALRDLWADGPSTYLGLTTVGFPNFFTLTGPGSPSVLSNMAVSIEQHVEWVSDCIDHVVTGGWDTIEPTVEAQSGWDRHVADCADITLYPQANSWYMGANVPGKPRLLLPYIGGVDRYRDACDDVVAADYLGFRFSGPAGARCHDGVVRSMQPDVAIVLEVMAGLGIPPVESMEPEAARALFRMGAEERPPGPEVGEIVDGVMPLPSGDLPYRLYRPAAPGPHPAVAYFHGGGWVLGDETSDDPLCRDLCDRAGTVVISVGYRHAPEHRFPTAADDAVASLGWIAANAAALGTVPGQLSVAGWSAGGNLAAVACQVARDAGGPAINGQLLLCPVTDCDASRPSYVDNADGYVLTAALMAWFWDHYADVADRDDPRASPLLGNLAGLPPAVVVTADFDPLRDEGRAYVDALAAAGVPARHVRARGHVHSSVPMVDIVISGAPVREAMAEALRGFVAAPARV